MLGQKSSLLGGCSADNLPSPSASAYSMMNEYPRVPEQPRTASRRGDLGGGSLSATQSQSQSESDDDEAELGLNGSSKKRKRDGRRDMNVT